MTRNRLRQQPPPATEGPEGSPGGQNEGAGRAATGAGAPTLE